jgi:hypothetical protein
MKGAAHSSPPFRPVVLIPSYNTGGPRLAQTVRDALAANVEVCVAIDGSTDGSADALVPLEVENTRLQVLRFTPNRGKGAVLQAAAEKLVEQGFTHAVAMDADGQHPGTAIPELIDKGRKNPEAVVMGQPVFGPEVPKARLYGRRLTIFWTELETLWCGLGDTLFGMRLYPLRPLLRAFAQTPCARGYDFDPEIAVRLCWLGCRPIPVAVPVRYFSAEEGGVSHFHYLRDNVKLTFLHFRLVPEFLLLRLWQIWKFRQRWKTS